MNRASLIGLTLLLAGLPLAADASPHRKLASSTQILTWIGQHLNQTVPWRDDQGGRHTDQYSLEFTGCKVTLTRVLDGSTHFIYGPFDLKYVAPSQIGVSRPGDRTGRFWVSLGFLHLVPRRVEDAQKERPVQSNVESFAMIYLPTQELASRQGKAWHDAVVVCGGRSVPDNLY